MSSSTIPTPPPVGEIPISPLEWVEREGMNGAEGRAYVVKVILQAMAELIQRNRELELRIKFLEERDTFNG